MKIAICSSMAFAKEMIQAKEDMVKLGHDVIIQDDVEQHASGEIVDEDKWRKMEIDPFKVYFEEIKSADAILVINLDKHEVKNYVGGNTLIEMAFAYVLDKKIFMVNPIPDLGYTDEIAAMKPTIINNDLKKII